ncbi:MAG: class I SAM-dependent rRNA methyltransferase, partial [Selenomonadaceae bacterium]|nr:class I SAM-dependent rRNA methyltransferase [Selenomonadaceae bacterium]
RAAIRAYAKGKRVLDLFTNQGGFALNAASAGAREVLAVDVSESALSKVEENAALNGFTNVKTVRADVFDLLRAYKKQGETFDLIVLDPPAFTKTADTVQAGYKGYVDINSLALKLLKEGGVLFTCSCSQHLTLPLFLKMAEEAADRAGVKVKLAEIRTQSPDHAAVLGQDEALYLKAAALIKCR